MKTLAKNKSRSFAQFSLMALAALLACSASTVFGQSALDGCDPNANGVVWVVVTQRDGKILVGGDFTTLSPNGGPVATLNHIARLNPDGTLDATLQLSSNSTV